MILSCSGSSFIVSSSIRRSLASFREAFAERKLTGLLFHIKQHKANFSLTKPLYSQTNFTKSIFCKIQLGTRIVGKYINQMGAFDNTFRTTLLLALADAVLISPIRFYMIFRQSCHALIFPHIYCIHVWGTTTSVHLHRLYVLQKKIIRLVCGFPPRTHTEPLYKSLHIVHVDQVRDYSIALFMYELMKRMLPLLF